MIPKKLIQSIRKNKKFLLTTHVNVEGDALGSVLGFYLLLKKLGKDPIVVIEDGISYEYAFLPQIDRAIKFNPKLEGLKFDCLVALDCSDLNRCGEVVKLNLQNKPVINIDHHQTNDRFGEVNWVDPKASSASEMVYHLYKKLGVEFDRDSALLLYVGIFTDTGSFRYSNTAGSTHKAAAELMGYGLNVNGIYRSVYENIPFKDLQMFSKISSTVKCCAKGRIAWVKISGGLLRQKKDSFDLSDHLLGYMRSIKDVEVAVLFKQNLGEASEIRVNLRSQGAVDVSKIAGDFGGGGHRGASGCTVKGKLEAVEKQVLERIKKEFRK